MNIKNKKMLLYISIALVTSLIFFIHKAVAQPLKPDATVSYIEPIVIESEQSLKDYARSLVISTWDSSQWDSFYYVIDQESSWIHNGAHYIDGRSSAFGLAGFLNATWGDVGCVKTHDKKEQIRCGVEYIKQRYGTPNKAAEFHRANNWY